MSASRLYAQGKAFNRILIHSKLLYNKTMKPFCQKLCMLFGKIKPEGNEGVTSWLAECAAIDPQWFGACQHILMSGQDSLAWKVGAGKVGKGRFQVALFKPSKDLVLFGFGHEPARLFMPVGDPLTHYRPDVAERDVWQVLAFKVLRLNLNIHQGDKAYEPAVCDDSS